MDAFERAFELVLKFEGGYVNDPDDPGKATKFGISQRQFPNLDIKNLTIEQAKEIYYKNYWLPAKCDKVADINIYLAILLFDTTVNIGIKTAVKILQKAINKYGFAIKEDGIIGEITLQHIKACNVECLIRDFCLERIRYYVEISKKKNLRKFLRGWIFRVLEGFDEVYFGKRKSGSRVNSSG
jgi:lysozyme family protein